MRNFSLRGYVKQPNGTYTKIKEQRAGKVTRPRQPRLPSSLESRFRFYWLALNGPPLLEEFKFCGSRKWRADFAHIESRTIFEIEGGVWNRGRHTRPVGFFADAEKYLEATLQGWRVIRLTEKQIKPQTIERIINHVQTTDR